MFSFLTKSKYSFEGIKPYEKVVILLYRHWFIIFIGILGYIFLALIPPLVYIFFSVQIGNIGLTQIFDFLTAIYYLFWWLGLFYTITMYLLDTWVVTDHRVLDNEQHGFFNRTLSEMHLSRIQDMSVGVRGVIPTFLNYGNLEIQTAGTEPKFIFKQIPDPASVKNLINETFNRYVEAHKDNVEVHELGRQP